MRVPGLPFGIGFVAALCIGWIGLPRALYEHSEQPLQFSHALHTQEQVGLSCDDCHGIDEQGRFVGIPSIAQCADCHAEVVGESDDERRLVEEFLRPGREIPWMVYARQPDTVFFPHAQHVRLAGLSCERCHGPHGTTNALRPFERNRLSGYSRDIWGRSIAGFARNPWDGMKMGDCSHCHRESGVVESCLDCHK